MLSLWICCEYILAKAYTYIGRYLQFIISSYLQNNVIFQIDCKGVDKYTNILNNCKFKKCDFITKKNLIKTIF